MTEPDLQQLAEAATPGPWQAYIAYSGEDGLPHEVGLYAGAMTTQGSENTIISDFVSRSENIMPDLEYIAAASPDRILALLDRLAAAEGLVEQLIAERDALAEDEQAAEARSTALEGALRETLGASHPGMLSGSVDHGSRLFPCACAWHVDARDLLAPPDEEAIK